MKKLTYCLLLSSLIVLGTSDHGLCASDEVVIKFGHILNVGHTVDNAARLMAKLASEKSNGKIKIEIYPGSQLGGERQLIEGAALGTVDMAECGSGMLGQFVKPYYINTMLYVYRDADHLHKVMWGPIGNNMADELLKRGIRVAAANWDRPPRHLYTIRPVQKPDDLKGLKLRVPESPVYLESWKALGAKPTPVTFSEIFTSLKLGVIEGLEMSVTSYYLQRYYEIAKYATETNHILECSMILVSEKLYKKLSPGFQKIILESAKEAGDWQRKQQLEDLKGFKEKLVSSGVTFLQTDVAMWQSKLKQEGVYEKLAYIWGGDKQLNDRIQSIK
jgi:TRAP-type transport system periplasmic protein